MIIRVIDLPHELYRRWDELVPGQPTLGRHLVSAYADPARRYHGLRHLVAVLEVVEDLAGEAANPATVQLAAWFHDAVYDVRAVDNEERSARWAETALSAAGLEAVVVGDVARLVRLTASHAPTAGDLDGIVLCDADLCILASHPAAYTAYTRAVGEEYGHVSDTDFRAGRAAVLTGLLALPALYGTTYGRTYWETPARNNLEGELARLREPRLQ